LTEKKTEKKTSEKTKTNDELAAEFEAEIVKYEEAQRAKARIFNPQELIKRAAKIHEVNHPVLGLVRFGELTFEDAFEIDKCKTDVEKTETVAWLMTRKAYPKLKRDFLKHMPLIESAALVDLLTKQPAFLSAQQNSQSGLQTTQEHKNSA
jgi:hypothetical protein